MKRNIYVWGTFLVILTACASGDGRSSAFPPSTRTYNNVAATQSPSTNDGVNPSATPWYELVDFNVKGVRIGAIEKEVREKLGRPARSRKVEVDNCGEETILRLNYPGLEIDLSPDETGKNYVALSFTVTTSKWDIGKGIRVGAPLDKVVGKFGKPWNDSYDATTESLGYSSAPGNDVGELFFRNGKLRKAKWYVNPC